jgi:hypothetical protein
MPPEFIPDNAMLVPTHAVGLEAVRLSEVGLGCVIKNRSLIVHPVSASVTVTVHNPELRPVASGVV